jgi:hypothetical protein
MAEDSASVDGEREHASSEITGDDPPKSPPAILTDSDWDDVLATLETNSLGARERFALDSIIFEFRYWAEQLRKIKADGRPPSEIHDGLASLSKLAEKLARGIRKIKQNEHAISAISAAMADNDANMKKSLYRSEDDILFAKMSASTRSLYDDWNALTDIDAIVQSVEFAHLLLGGAAEYVEEGKPGAAPLLVKLTCRLDIWLTNSRGDHLVRTSEQSMSGKRGGKAGKHRTFVKKISDLTGISATNSEIENAIKEAGKTRTVVKSS